MTPAYTHRIWIAGDISDARRAIQEWCTETGDCYAVSACDYVYSGGVESGVCVTRINYDRFPEDEEQLLKRVLLLSAHLAKRLFQKSYSIETPRQMLYLTTDGPWSSHQQEGKKPQ